MPDEPLLFILPVSSPGTTTALNVSKYGTPFPIVVPASDTVSMFGLAHTGVIGSPMHKTYDEEKPKPHTGHLRAEDRVTKTLECRRRAAVVAAGKQSKKKRSKAGSFPHVFFLLRCSKVEVCLAVCKAADIADQAMTHRLFVVPVG